MTKFSSTAGGETQIVLTRPVESYVRMTVEVPGGSVEVGLQRQLGEPMRLLRSEIRRLVEESALILNGEALNEDNGRELTDLLEVRFRSVWPARAWFLELWLGEEALSQVYAPWGMPIHDR